MISDIQRGSDELAHNPASLAFIDLGEALRRDGQIEVAFRIARRGLDRHDASEIWAGRPARDARPPTLSYPCLACDYRTS